MLKSPANNTSLFLRSIVDNTIESSFMNCLIWSCNILGSLYKLQMITLLGKPPDIFYNLSFPICIFVYIKENFVAEIYVYIRY